MVESYEVKGWQALLGASRRISATRYPTEFKLKPVKLVLEGGFSRALVREELTVCYGKLLGWIDRRQQDAVLGLEPVPRRDAGRDKLPAAIAEEIVALKREQPQSGLRGSASCCGAGFCCPPVRRPSAVGSTFGRVAG